MLTAPAPLVSTHQLTNFDSGVASLDDWLKRRALQNQASGAARTFVVCEGPDVIAYYALVASAVATSVAAGKFRRNMPEPIPVIVLGRLAIARTHHRRGLGRALFQDTARRVLHAGETIGVRDMLVHAISEEAKDFYLRLGLSPSPLEPMTLMVTAAELRLAVKS